MRMAWLSPAEARGGGKSTSRGLKYSSADVSRAPLETPHLHSSVSQAILHPFRSQTRHVVAVCGACTVTLTSPPLPPSSVKAFSKQIKSRETPATVCASSLTRPVGACGSPSYLEKPLPMYPVSGRAVGASRAESSLPEKQTPGQNA